MPYLVSTSFDEFLARISLAGSQQQIAESRSKSISDLLKKSFSLLAVFPTGSLLRGTALKGVSDVDVIAVLHFGKHIEGKSPIEVLQSVRDALSSYNAQIVKKNGQAVTLYFKTWPNVDIVPAKRMNNDHSLRIPDANDGTWIATNPKEHDRAVSQMPLHGRQLIRMVKCWNHAHSALLQSFHLETIALRTARETAVDSSESAWPWLILQFFETAKAMTEPSAEISASYGVDRWSDIRTRLSNAIDRARSAWYAVHENQNYKHAIERYRVMFGERFPAYG